MYKFEIHYNYGNAEEVDYLYCDLESMSVKKQFDTYDQQVNMHDQQVIVNAHFYSYISKKSDLSEDLIRDNCNLRGYLTAVCEGKFFDIGVVLCDKLDDVCNSPSSFIVDFNGKCEIGEDFLPIEGHYYIEGAELVRLVGINSLFFGEDSIICDDTLLTSNDTFLF